MACNHEFCPLTIHCRFCGISKYEAIIEKYEEEDRRIDEGFIKAGLPPLKTIAAHLREAVVDAMVEDAKEQWGIEDQPIYVKGTDGN